MRKVLFPLLVAVTLTACVHGRVERGSRIDPDSIPPRDTVATLSPDMPPVEPEDSTGMDEVMADSLLQQPTLYE